MNERLVIVDGVSLECGWQITGLMLLSGGSDGTGFPLPPLYYVNAFVLCA